MEAIMKSLPKFNSVSEQIGQRLKTLKVIQENKEEQKHTLVFALDNECIRNSLTFSLYPSTSEAIGKSAQSSLQKRINIGNMEIGIQRGCPQGSLLGPGDGYGEMV